MPSTEAMTLGRVVAERLLLVPDYQRPYAWETRQLNELWQDLDLMGDKARHYTGTLVLRPSTTAHLTSGGEVLTECDVVDGQQRLTTCLLLLDRIRRRLERQAATCVEGAAELANGIRNTFGAVTVDGVSRPRLRLAAGQNDFWVDVIFGDGQVSRPLTEGQRRLRQGARFFDERIRDLVEGKDPETALHQVQRLHARVANGLRFLVYEVDSSSDAGVIFETLNGRGRDLTELDKIKNYLLFLAHTLPDAQAEHLALRINTAWADIHDHLAGTGLDEDQLLRAHWLATQNADPKSWKQAASIKAQFSRARFVPNASRLTTDATSSVELGELRDELVSSVTDYVQTLALCALFDRELVEVGAKFTSFGQSAARALYRTASLRRAGLSTAFRPLLFAARLTHPDDGEFYSELANECENFAARVYTLGKYRSHTGQSPLYHAAHRLYSEEWSTDDILRCIRELTWSYADDDLVRRALASEEEWYKRPDLRYFLYEYELSLTRSVHDVADFSTFASGSNSQKTVEHVLPQNPDWESGDWSDFSIEQHGRLLHSIGNLVLTYDNSSYGRNSFQKKKGSPRQSSPPCYAHSALAQERELSNKYADWTPETIAQRAQQLTTWALKRWHVDASDRAGELECVEESPDDAFDEDEDLPTIGVTVPGTGDRTQESDT